MKFNQQFAEERVSSRNDKEKNRLPSMTIPDQTMSMKEIMRRHAHGLPIGGQRTPFYDEESDLPDPRTLDLSEIQEFRDEYLEKVEELNVKKSAAARAKAEKQRLDEIEAEVKKRQDKITDEKSTKIS